MKRFFWLIFCAFSLASCVLHDVKESGQGTDQIHALLTENGKLYALGNTLDYEITQPEIVDFFKKFAYSPYRKQMLNLKLKFKVINHEKLAVAYQLFLSRNGLSPADIQTLKTDFGFLDNEISRQYQPELLTELAGNSVEKLTVLQKEEGYSYLDDTPRVDFAEKNQFGRVLKLENREKWLAQYRLAKPLPVRVLYYDSKVSGGRSVLASAMTVTGALLTPIWLPLYGLCKLSGVKGTCAQ